METFNFYEKEYLIELLKDNSLLLADYLFFNKKTTYSELEENSPYYIAFLQIVNNLIIIKKLGENESKYHSIIEEMERISSHFAEQLEDLVKKFATQPAQAG